ncbi:site-specific DNA-methyltransferase [Flavobacterium tyrosinilyticum]|uniref:site-specific DNA-methyltransferase n=1 Tax=Flavobacterium tyrosinilyticum TaxID=1658740 RepID=UPI00202FE9C5|nr:site-specific DNA-methyltransferase [Flavobacterium tyrosinilyticum]MCM0666403.1 site-specific DNA-methyltransferase [Flavobacterium tyrosinilyticum]
MSIEQVKKGDELTQSLDIVNDNIARLKELFPEVLTEGKIDFKVLQDILGKEIEDEEEYYRFTWAGKAQARREAHKPSTGTLRPAKDESVNWDTTENLYLEGDNLEVLKLLQKSYNNKVKMIYIDPPYNTGKDFVYKDNYTDNLKNYQQITGQVDDEGNKLSTNSDSDGRYHSNWLNMMYPRLSLARNLLKDDGVIFMSIDDNEVENLKKLSNEIFGEDNFVAQLIWERAYSPVNLKKHFSENHDFILCFAKNVSNLINNGLKRSEEANARYSNPDNDSRGIWKSSDLSVGPAIQENIYEITLPTGRTVLPPKGYSWRLNKERFDEFCADNRIWFGANNDATPSIKRFLSEVKDTITPMTIWKYSEVGHSQEAMQSLKKLFNGQAYFDYPKPVNLIKRELELYTSSDDLIVDFFSGSATTAHAVMQLNAEDQGNRKFIQVQLPEPTNEKSDAFKDGYKSIVEIGKERIRRAGNKIVAEETERLNKLKSKNSLLQEDKDEIDNLQIAIDNLDIGFKVFKLDSSNIKGWDGNPDNLVDNLFDSQDNIKTGRTEEDVLFEILLKYGLDLTLPIEEKLIEGKKVFSVGFGALFICLANNITNKVAEGIGAWKEALNPEACRVIFKDSGFGDVEKTNSVQTLKRFGINEIKSI